MPLFGFLKSKDKAGKENVSHVPVGPPKPSWTDAWTRTDVALEEVEELVHALTITIKKKGVGNPFWLLPFRLDNTISDENSTKIFIRGFSQARFEHSSDYTGLALQQDLELSDLPVLASILRWVWSRIPGGVVTWEVYELFRIGETDSNMSKHAFDHFIPLSVDSARKNIIYDFFELMATIAASSKTNGFGGRKLARFMGYYAFEFDDAGNGMEGGYKNWERAADAATHLFLAYLRSRSPDNTKGAGGVTDLPRALQSFLSSTEYPPVTPTLLQTSTYKVLMIVDRVSPTPFQLLRRSKHFEYRDDMEALQDFSYYEDPVSALTDECRRVLNAISSVNSTSSSQGADRNNGWLQFESRGFNHDFDPLKPSKPASIAEDVGAALPRTHRDLQGLRSTPGVEFDSNGRPKTPSWGDFLSRGFVDEKTSGPGPMLLHPNKQLPPIGERAHSSQSHMRKLGDDLEPGELASITTLELDETFWWVWLTSLAGEETAKRKAIFGRCCMIETKIHGAKWLIVEEQVKGASPGPDEGAYIAEKKSKFSWTRRSRNKRTKSTKQKEHPYTDQANTTTPASKTSIGLDQQAKIQAAAAELARKQQTERQVAQRRARKDEASSIKTNSVLTIQPALKADALPAMKWAKEFDKDVIRAKYLQDKSAGKGAALDEPIYERVGAESNGSLTPTAHNGSYQRSTSRLDKEVPPAPLPVTPTKDISQAQLAESSSAAKVPLPPGPEDKPSPRPPIPAPQQPDLNQHPALRNQPTPQPESPPQQKTSPPAKAAPKKLKKHSGGGGFKKLFSSKKKETASRSGTPQPTHLEEPEPSAADEPVQSASLAPPEAAVNPGRASPVITHSPAIEQSPAAEAVRHHDDDYPPPTSREQHEADREFSRFDQGPLQDVPAFVPEDESPKPSRSRTPQQTASTPTHQYEDPISPVEDARRDDADNESEVSVDLARQVSPQDRWAEIRRQAQERAQRMSEENTRRSQRSQSVRTDEGETSGEETIEHRVARIKARVAELTGQMDSSGTVRNSPR